MGVAITLRRGPDESPFKRMLLRLCQVNTGGGLLLCSGYIWEEDGRGYSVSSDGLAAAIIQGIGSNPVTVIAGKLGDNTKWPFWETKYGNFIRALENSGLNVQAFVATGRNWHAKVAVRFDANNQPVAGIVGSSNLTGPAYRENYGNWNYEADVLLWKPGDALDKYLTDLVEEIDDPFGKMFLDMATHVKQPGEVEWLRTLVSDAQEGGLEPFHQV